MFVVITRLLIISCLLLSFAQGQRTQRKRRPFTSRFSNKGLCKNRPINVAFRKESEANLKDCRKYYKCVSRIKTVKAECSPPLVFDIDKGICDYDYQVNNCNRTDKLEYCNDDQFDTLDCVVKVKEEIVPQTLEEDKEGECDPQSCSLPACFCSVDGTLAPILDGVEPQNQKINDLPMIVTISFNGAVNGETFELFQKLFTQERLNPNGCTVKGTWFVSHKYTNYSAVQELHRLGHEIGVFSISSNGDEEYWSKGGYETWKKEMVGNRAIIEKFANITDNSIIGVRAPRLKLGGNAQFAMMKDSYFEYDASITAPKSVKPVWPYTLDYRVPHKCHNDNCPTEPYPGIWELPINALDRREDLDFDEELTGCQLVSSCTNIQDKDQFRQLLDNNFKRHYGEGNRAPLSLSLNPTWLLNIKGAIEEFGLWMDSILKSNNDVYFLTDTQVLQWMKDPTSNLDLKDFSDWKTKCQVTGQPACNRPNACPRKTSELPSEINRLHTCMDCPTTYPWIRDPEGDGILTN